MIREPHIVSPSVMAGGPLLPASAALLCALLAAVGCGGDRSGEVAWIELPPAPHSSAPSLTAQGDDLLLSWVERTQDEKSVLRYARWSDDEWKEPRTVAPASADLRLESVWSDPPQLAARLGGGLLVAWSRSAGGRGYGIDRFLTESTDGREWREGAALGGRGDGRQRGWGTLLTAGSVDPVAEDSVGIAWLETGNGGTRLLYQEWESDGRGPEEIVDDDVCPWCRVAGVRFRGRSLLAYRDRSSAGVRDSAIRRRTQQGWSPTQSIHEDGWKLGSCPGSGPALALAGERLVAVWFTAADDDPRVLVASSSDGVTFEAPRRVDDGDPLGRVAAAGWDDGSLYVSWFERTGRDATVRLRRIDPAGAGDEAVVLGPTETGTAAGIPRMARTADRVYVAWTAPGPPSSIHVASIRP